MVKSNKYFEARLPELLAQAFKVASLDLKLIVEVRYVSQASERLPFHAALL